MNFAIAGYAGSGKSQAADYLVKKYGYTKLSFADGIKKIDNELFNRDGIKSRSRLQKIGEYMRAIDSDVWINDVLNRVELLSDKDIVIDDLRRENEFYALRDEGFFSLKIIADEDIRIKRLVDRDGMCDVSLLYNESETGVADIKMYEIYNNGTLEELYEQINKLILALEDIKYDR